jgi:hypothetical protein
LDEDKLELEIGCVEESGVWDTVMELMDSAVLMYEGWME